MVFRRRTNVVKRRVKRRRVRYPAKRYRRSTVSIPRYRSLSKLPECLFRKLAFHKEYDITNVASTLTSYGYFKSSLYFPYSNDSSPYPQPFEFDQMALMYQNYRVIGIGYKITFINWYTDNPSYCFVRVQTDPTSRAGIDSLDTIMVRPDTRHQIMASRYNPAGIRTFKGYYSTAKILAVSPKEVRSDSSYSATVTADPAKMFYIYPMVWCAQGSNYMRVNVHLTYYCEFFNHTTLSPS